MVLFGDKEEQYNFCPKCNSNNFIRKKKAGYLLILSILVIGFPLPFLKKTYYCFDCENEWK